MDTRLTLPSACGRRKVSVLSVVDPTPIPDTSPTNLWTNTRRAELALRYESALGTGGSTTSQARARDRGEVMSKDVSHEKVGTSELVAVPKMAREAVSGVVTNLGKVVGRGRPPRPFRCHSRHQLGCLPRAGGSELNESWGGKRTQASSDRPRDQGSVETSVSPNLR